MGLIFRFLRSKRSEWPEVRSPLSGEGGRKKGVGTEGLRSMAGKHLVEKRNAQRILAKWSKSNVKRG